MPPVPVDEGGDTLDRLTSPGALSTSRVGALTICHLTFTLLKWREEIAPWRLPRVAAGVMIATGPRRRRLEGRAPMGIDATTRRDTAVAFLDALDRAAEADNIQHALGEVSDLLPEPDVWAIVGDEDDAALLLLAGDVLFTLAVDGSVEGWELVATSHRVRVTGVDHRWRGRRTLWKFGFRDREPFKIDGRLGQPSRPGESGPPDKAEEFARALASRAGWGSVVP